MSLRDSHSSHPKRKRGTERQRGEPPGTGVLCGSNEVSRVFQENRETFALADASGCWGGLALRTGALGAGSGERGAGSCGPVAGGDGQDCPSCVGVAGPQGPGLRLFGAEDDEARYRG